MLTLQEIRDEFVVEYKLIVTQRDLKQIDFGNKIIASWIASGQQKIADKLKVLIKYVDIYYDEMTEFYTFGLPDDYGGFISTDPQLKQVSISQLNTQVQEDETLTQGEIHSIAIYHDGDGYKLGFMDLPTSAGRFRLWYSVNPLYYSPSAGSNQDWGNFDGSTFSGNLVIPDKYKDLLILFMLGKCFDDKKQEFENELIRSAGMSGATSKDEIEYTPIGGY